MPQRLLGRGALPPGQMPLRARAVRRGLREAPLSQPVQRPRRVRRRRHVQVLRRLGPFRLLRAQVSNGVRGLARFPQAVASRGEQRGAPLQASGGPRGACVNGSCVWHLAGEAPIVERWSALARVASSAQAMAPATQPREPACAKMDGRGRGARSRAVTAAPASTTSASPSAATAPRAGRARIGSRPVLAAAVQGACSRDCVRPHLRLGGVGCSEPFAPKRHGS